MAKTVLNRAVKKMDFDRLLAKAMFESPTLRENMPDIAFFDCTKTTWGELFTEKRLEILRIIAQKEPKNISELADLTNRDIENIYRDLKILEDHGMVSLEKNGRETKPELKYSTIVINFK